MGDDFSNHRLFFDAMREVVGEEGIDHLRRHFGGSALYVPCVRLQAASPLAEALGMDAATAIVDRLRVIGADDRPLGGFSVYVAAGPYSAREMRRAEVVADVRAGMTQRAAARQAGVSCRTAGRAVRGRVPSRSDLCAILDAALVAAHADDPTSAGIAARLGIKRKLVNDRIARARERTGLALALNHRPRRSVAPHLSRAAATEARDAAMVAAHAEDPTSAGMAARLGIDRQSVRNRIARARERTGLALPIVRPARGKPMPPSVTAIRRDLQTTHAAGARPLSDRDAALIAGHGEGLSPQDIAARTGRPLAYVHSRFWRLRKSTGLSLTFSRKPAQDQIWGEHVRSRQAQVAACLREGLSRAQVAQRLGIGLSTVGNFRAKLRRETGEDFAPPPRDHPHNRAGERNRSTIAAAFEPGVTLDDITARTGLSRVVVGYHLRLLRRGTGQAFTLARTANVDRPSP